MRKVVLATSSPWRRQLFKKASIPFIVVESGYEEYTAQRLPPRALVKRFALGKARAVSSHYPRAIIIGFDTVIVRGTRVLGKPASAAMARRELKQWSGKTGCAITGFAILDAKTGRSVVRTVETILRFRTLSQREIEAYVRTGEPLTGAGAFTIQGGAASFVESIQGDFYNIAGLPLAAVVKALKKFGP